MDRSRINFFYCNCRCKKPEATQSSHIVFFYDGGCWWLGKRSHCVTWCSPTPNEKRKCMPKHDFRFFGETAPIFYVRFGEKKNRNNLKNKKNCRRRFKAEKFARNVLCVSVNQNGQPRKFGKKICCSYSSYKFI